MIIIFKQHIGKKSPQKCGAKTLRFRARKGREKNYPFYCPPCLDKIRTSIQGISHISLLSIRAFWGCVNLVKTRHLIPIFFAKRKDPQGSYFPQGFFHSWCSSKWPQLVLKLFSHIHFESQRLIGLTCAFSPLGQFRQFSLQSQKILRRAWKRWCVVSMWSRSGEKYVLMFQNISEIARP